jgi:hypothetical protein
MTGEILPCQTPAIVDRNDPDHRGRDGQPPRRQRQHHPPQPHAPTDTRALDLPDPANPPHIGTRINVRV